MKIFCDDETVREERRKRPFAAVLDDIIQETNIYLSCDNRKEEEQDESQKDS